MKSVLIIGMGIFGQTLAQKMMELGHEVMIVDKDESLIQELSESFPDAFTGDCTHPGVLRALGVNNFDICFVAVGEEYYASLEITSILKDLGAKRIVSKAKRNRQAGILKKLGADEVVFPEKDTAERLAMRSSAKNLYDYFSLDADHAVYEIPILRTWAGRTIAEIDVRRKYHLNIIAIRNGQGLNTQPGPQYTFVEGDHMVVVASSGTMLELSESE